MNASLKDWLIAIAAITAFFAACEFVGGNDDAHRYRTQHAPETTHVSA